MLFKIIYYLGNSLSSEDSSTDEGILITFDRNFIKDKTFNGRIKPDKQANTMASIFLWDKYFPKPLFYRIKIEPNKKGELIALIKNESDPENKIFKVREDLKNKTYKIVESDDLNDEYEYYIFCKEENVYSIKKSIDYFLMTELIRPLYEKLLIKLCIYVYKIRRLKALAENETVFNDTFEDIWDARIGLIEIINTIAKRLALMRIPSRNEPDLMIFFDEIENKLDNALKSLLKTLKEFEKLLNSEETSKMINGSKISKIKGVMLEFKGYVMRDLKRNQFSIICNEIIVSFDNFKVFASEIKTSKSKNTEITLECDSNALKYFIDTYFNLLYKYCEVMENIDEIYLTNYCFHKLESGYPREKILEEINMDKLVAEELKKYLNNFPKDMTDFMIFSQTDYFKKEFSTRLLTNLDYLVEANEQKGFFSGNLFVEHKYFNLVDFYNLWSAILYDPHKETIMSMEDLIKNMKKENDIFKRRLGSFLHKYFLIILIVIMFGLTVLFIRLQRPSRFIN